MKRAIIVRGQSNSGKSTVLNNIHHWITTTHSTTLIHSVPLTGDIYQIFSVGKLIIGFCSEGDYGPSVQLFLDDCIARNCDLIIGSCRGKGATYQAILSTLVKPFFIVNYTITYHVSPHLITTYNAQWFDEIQALIIGLN